MTCERGFQRREVACMYQLQNGSLIHTKEPYCQGGKPPVLQGCEGRLCLTVWEASEWSKVGGRTDARVGSLLSLHRSPVAVSRP